MDAIKKQASKLREQVARQQQVILRQLGQLGHEGVMIDETDMHCHQQLQNLYKSTRAAKHFQRDIVRGLEGLISTSKKQMVIARKLSEDSCKYGIENQDSTYALARIASNFGTSHASMEDHRETMLGILSYQVSEPLRAMMNGAPLEDARHLTHRYDRMRQEIEIQAAEVIRRQSKFRDSSAENVLKLRNAEKKLSELKSSMLALGREATAAMLSVEDQQQESTFRKILAMVDAERSYHQNAVAILEKLHSEMILEEQVDDSSLSSENPSIKDSIPPANDEKVSIRSISQNEEDKNDSYFLAKVIHSFEAQADGELTLEVDDYVVVRQVRFVCTPTAFMGTSGVRHPINVTGALAEELKRKFTIQMAKISVASNGWSEGECKGTTGWFPSAYVTQRDRVPATKLSENELSQQN